MNEVASRSSSYQMNLLGSEPAIKIEINNPQAQRENESNNLKAQREKINQFIRKNYKVYLSNVDELDEAEVICLGDSHSTEMHTKINAQIVDMLYEPQSILLNEKANANQEKNGEASAPQEEKNRQAKYVKSPIKIQGWDIKDDEIAEKEAQDFVRAANIYDEGPKVADFMSLSKLEKFKNDLENNQLSTCSKIAKVFSCCCTLCCTALFVKSCKPCIKKYYKSEGVQNFQKILHRVPARNQKMCEIIQDVLKVYKKVFVMAGSKHFDFVEDGEGFEGIDYRPSNQAVEQTIGFLATKKFAILIPKDAEDLKDVD